MARMNVNHGGGTKQLPKFTIPVYTFGIEPDDAVTPHTQHVIQTARPAELAAAAAGCAVLLRDARDDQDTGDHDRALVRMQLIMAELARRHDPDHATIEYRTHDPMNPRSLES
jgi:hypothetical protein